MVKALDVALLGGALIAAGAVAKYTGAGVGLGELAEGSRKLVVAPLSGTAQGITELSISIGAAGKGLADAVNAIGGALRNSICFINPAACSNGKEIIAPPGDREGVRPIPISTPPIVARPLAEQSWVSTSPIVAIPLAEQNVQPIYRISSANVAQARQDCPNCSTAELFTRAGGRPITEQQIYSGLVAVY